MDTAKQLSNFLRRASKNRRFRQSHLSLYSAILMSYSNGLCQNPFRVSRRDLMKHSAIHSFATYHKCITDLVDSGYINYQPSYNPTLASSITLISADRLQAEMSFSIFGKGASGSWAEPYFVCPTPRYGGGVRTLQGFLSALEVH